VPDPAIGLVEVVGIQLPFVERTQAPGAETIVVAPAVDAHHRPDKVRVRVETFSAPLAACWASRQADRNAILLLPGEAHRLGWGCATAAFGQVAKEIATAFVGLDVKGQPFGD